MNKRKYVIFILLCITAWLQAQNSVKTFDEFFVAGMKKIDGVFPVYVGEKDIYLEIPDKYIGREIEVRGQIDRGFDLLNRPVNGLGVVRVMSPDKATICFQKPFYTERILDEKSVYQKSFSLSNIQPAGESYPVVAYSKEQGAIIRITEYLINGNDWFSYDYGFIRSLVPELSEVTKIHPFVEGVSFTVRRYHGVEAERYMFSSSAIILPEGSMPLEVTCVVRLLPQKKDQIRLADYRIPYQTLTFKDYSQNPYCMVEDSLILRWDMSQPLIFYVDTLFPKEYFQAVKEGISVWNTAFRKAGIRDALQVKYANSKIIPAEQSAFISYDLRMPGIKSDFTYHPRTGEILSCRLNIGHGFLKGKLDDYLLSCGASDPRIVADHYSKEVEKELLQSEMTEEIGYLLGLRRSLSKDSYGMILKVGDDDCRAIYFGYNFLKGSGSCYDEREKLRQWIDKNLPDRIHSLHSSDYATKISNLQVVVNQLDKIVYKGKKRDKESSLTDIYRKAVRLYGSYLIGIAKTVGSSQPADAQHQAMLDLDKYLFHSAEKMECTYVKENLLVVRNNILYPELVKLFKQLLSIETVSALRLQALHSDQKGYGDVDFFQDLYKGLFNDFNSSATVSYEQMDIQLICLEAWLDIIQEDAKHNSAAKRLKDELYSLYNRLEKLSTIHPQAEVRDMYTLLMRRIK
ncbi:DUF5117 domain-containing protein [uncultured Bacteroides sp.]|uniref:DUF5117 and DUF5118 domain-containing protein n=1 Tax=uncultured Bacteroides sp. TaxID=162156 RepID=UPI0025FEDBA7|nr:DUF5117 domain-containing protein [uncultured Bacteroides sp.]